MQNKLHEVMLKLVNTENGIQISRVVEIINATRLYEKKNKSDITPNQIYARVHQYPHLFYTKDGRLYKR